MDVKQQEYFVAIVEEGSISKAAKKLFISQPTLSQFLSKLESSEGVQLITRSSNNSLGLTEAGKLFYESAKKIMLIRDDFENKFAELNESGISNLIIGNNMPISMSMMIGIVSDLSSVYPNVKVSFRHGKSYKLAEMLAAGELDLSFSAYREKNPKFEYIDFSPMEMMIVLYEGHPLYHLGSPYPSRDLPHISLRQFEKESFVLLYPGTFIRDSLDEYCIEHGIKLNIKLEVYTSTVAQEVVESGHGISIYYPDSANKNEKLRYIGLEPPLYHKWGLYYNKSTYQTAYFRDFVKAAKRIAETGRFGSIKKEHTDGR